MNCTLNTIKKIKELHYGLMTQNNEKKGIVKTTIH